MQSRIYSGTAETGKCSGSGAGMLWQHGFAKFYNTVLHVRWHSLPQKQGWHSAAVKAKYPFLSF